VYGKQLKNSSPVVNSAGMLTCSSLMMLPPAILIDTPWSVDPSLAAISE
jgi:hypothetical protein